MEPLPESRRNVEASSSTAVPHTRRRSFSKRRSTRRDTTSTFTSPSITARRVLPFRPQKGASGANSYPSCAAVASPKAVFVAQSARKTIPSEAENIDGATSSTRKPPPPFHASDFATRPSSSPLSTSSSRGRANSATVSGLLSMADPAASHLVGHSSGGPASDEAIQHHITRIRCNLNDSLQ